MPQVLACKGSGVFSSVLLAEDEVKKRQVHPNRTPTETDFLLHLQIDNHQLPPYP
jgi:predicted urease superfamily metal-dependent hydrolase